jgi:hypothetical protein
MGWFDTLTNLLAGKRTAEVRTGSPISTTDAASSTTSPIGMTIAPKRGGAGSKSATLNKLIFQLDNYVGPHSRSPNGRWVLSWSDFAPAMGIGGHRESGNGSYLLYDTEAGQVVVCGEMARPNGGHVADSGHFSIEDWHFGSSLSGTFNVFEPNGQLVIAKDVTANILMSEISSNGLFAVFQTANSTTEDCHKLFLIDVSQRAIRYSIDPLAGWPERYSIDEDTAEVIAHMKDLGAFRYDSKGAFIDAAKLAKAKLVSSRYEFAIPAAEALLKSPNLTAETARQALDILGRARKHGADQIDFWKARSLKLQGLAHEALGELREAVKAFDEALALNPKIGVKRKRDSLAKKIG